MRGGGIQGVSKVSLHGTNVDWLKVGSTTGQMCGHAVCPVGGHDYVQFICAPASFIEWRVMLRRSYAALHGGTCWTANEQIGGDAQAIDQEADDR